MARRPRRHHRSAATLRLPVVRLVLRGVAGLALGGLSCLVPAFAGEIRATSGSLSLGTTVNGAASCSAGACAIGGGTTAGANLFHRFSSFDTRGAISAVQFATQGQRLLIVGVTNPLGSFLDKPIAMSSPAALIWLSPGGIQLGSGVSFSSIPELRLSTASGLRFSGGGQFDAFSTAAAALSGLAGDPLPGSSGLLSDPAALAAAGLTSNGDISLAGGLLSVDSSLLLDAQGGNVLLEGARLTATASGGAGSTGTGGSIAVTGASVTIKGATLDASGPAGGGTVLVGGALQGGAGLNPARSTVVDAASSLRADAIENGKGGTVVVWSEATTRMDGAISARGGANGGDGGLMEVSSRGQLIWGGSVDGRAPFGAQGTLLLDPFNITISNGIQTTQPDFTPTTDDSVINVGLLVNALDSSNVRVSTGIATPPTNGTITLADPLIWLSPNTLTLEAAAGINLNAQLVAPSGGLTLQAGSTINAIAPVSVARFELASGNWVQNGASVPGLAPFSAGDFRITGGSFLRAAGGTGTSADPYLLTDIYGLQGVGSSFALRAASYRLSNNIDASGTGLWNGGAGFVPIGAGAGAGSPTFRGSLDGAGHVITGLTINRPGSDDVGLIGTALDTPLMSITNLGLEDVAITGRAFVGGLAGESNGNIFRSYVTGSVTGLSDVGGLVGAYFEPGIMAESYAASTVQGGNYVGGLVGYQQRGVINKAYASGTVAGNEFVGGLVGESLGSIDETYASGLVSGSSNVGGLVGLKSDGSLTKSYWNSETTGQNTSSGGGTPLNKAQMRLPGSFDAWDFSPTGAWTLTNAPRPFLRNLQNQQANIATVFVVPQSRVYDGQFDTRKPQASYSLTGFSTSPEAVFTISDLPKNVGDYIITANGLSTQKQVVSEIVPGTLTITPADLTLSGSRNYDGSTDAPGSTLTALGVNGESFSLTGSGSVLSKNVGTQSLSSLGDLALDQGNNGGLASNYNPLSTSGSSYIINPAQLSLSASSDTKTYDGTTNSTGAVTVTGLFSPDNISGLSQRFLSKDVLGVDASTLEVNPGFIVNDGNGGSNYIISTNTASGTISQALVQLTLSASSDTKTYDGTTNSTGAVTVTGLFSPDFISGLSQSFLSKNVLGVDGSTLEVNPGFIVNDGNGGNNYTISTNTASGTISQALLQLTLSASSDTKTYDGTTNSTGAVTVTGLFSPDFISGLSQSFLSKNVLGVDGSTLEVNPGFIVNDGNGGNNYNSVVLTNTAVGTINPAQLTLSANSDTKSYDGTTNSTGAVTVTGLFSPDNISGLSQRFLSKNVLGANLSTLEVNPGFIVNDGNEGSNYTVVATNTAAGTINPAQLTLSATSDTKTYDGTTNSTGAVTVTGLFSPDNISGLSQSFRSKDVLGVNLSTLEVNPGFIVNDGNGGNNYTISTNTASGTISQALLQLTLSASSDTKTYDGTTNSTGAVTVTGLFSPDFISGLSQSFLSKNVLGVDGSTLEVNPGFIVNDGNGGNNYNSVVLTNTAVGTINPAQLTLSANSDTKTYDGTTNSTGAVTVTGLFSPDNISGLSQRFLSKNVLGANLSTLEVNPGFIVNDGNEGSNYTVVATNTAAGTINPKQIFAFLNPQNKPYDGNPTAAPLTPASFILSGFVPGEGASINQTAATYNSPNVVGATSVSTNLNTDLTSTSLNYVANPGTLLSNYNLASSASGSGSITPATLNLSGNRLYDGTTAAPGSTLTAFGVNSERFSLTGTGSVASKNVGTQSLSSLGDLALDQGSNGALASNYAPLSTSGSSYIINPAQLTLSANSDTKTYDGTTNSTGEVTVTGLSSPDFISGLSQSFRSKDVLGVNLSTLEVNPGFIVNDGNEGSNYTISTNTASGSINPKKIFAFLNPQTKTYDGTAFASLTPSDFFLIGLVSGEGASINQNSGAYNSANVIEVSTVTAALSSANFAPISGTLLSNYILPTIASGSGSITQKPLTARIQPQTKVYDATAFASLTPSDFILSGLVSGEGASINQPFGTYNSRNVVAATTVNATLISSNYEATPNTLLSNYELAQTASGPGTISRAPLTISAVSDSRVFDGSTRSTQIPVITAGELRSGDTLSNLSQSFTTGEALGDNRSTLVVDPTFVIADGSNGTNYFVTLISALGTIKPLPINNVEPDKPTPPSQSPTTPVQPRGSDGLAGDNAPPTAVATAPVTPTTSTIDSTSSQNSVAAQEQALLGMAQRLNLADDASQQQSLSTQQVQALLNQIENAIRVGTP